MSPARPCLEEPWRAISRRPAGGLTAISAVASQAWLGKSLARDTADARGAWASPCPLDAGTRRSLLRRVTVEESRTARFPPDRPDPCLRATT